MSTDVPSGFLEFLHDIQLSDEKLVFPTVEGLEEITLDDFTGERYFVDATRPFIIMMCCIPLWFILMIMSKRHCFDRFICATSDFCRVITTVCCVGTSLIFMALGFPGNAALQEGLKGYAASSLTAVAALEQFETSFQSLDAFLEVEVLSSCNSTDSNVTEALEFLNISLVDLDLRLETAFGFSNDVIEAGNAGAEAIVEGLEWIDITFILLTVLLASTAVVLGVAAVRAYRFKMKGNKDDEDTCSNACFTIVYTFGMVVILIVWIIAAILSVPTYVGADLCVGDSTLNLQEGLKRSIVSGTDENIDDIDLCNVTSSGFETPEEQLGNIACYYSECRGELFVVEGINETESLNVLQNLTQDLLDQFVTDSNCTDQLTLVQSAINLFISETNDFDIECENLAPIFIETVEVDLCDQIVAGVATISFTWGVSTSLLMLAMVIGLVNSKKTLKQYLKERRARIKKKQKQDRRSMRRINEALPVAPTFGGYEGEEEEEFDNAGYLQSNQFPEEEDEEDDGPNIDADPDPKYDQRRSSHGISF